MATGGPQNLKGCKWNGNECKISDEENFLLDCGHY